MFTKRTMRVVLPAFSLFMLGSLTPAFGLTPFSMQDTVTASPPAFSTAVLDTTSQPLTSEAETRRGGIARNFSEWTAQGGWVMYPIYGILILGLGVIMYQFVHIFFDKRYAKPIFLTLEKKFDKKRAYDESEVEELWQLAREHPKSKIAQLLDRLCELWQRDSSAEALQVEIDSFVKSIKERYEVGRSFAMLLSDTAGALGLLGTVLGMYQTFMPGQLESSQIISGMGVALVTTIGGLIVSIILNFGISWAHSTFHRHMELVAERADLFRNRFGKSQSAFVSAKDTGLHPGAFAASPPNNNLAVKSAPPPSRIPSRLKILSGNHQVADAGSMLPKALEVAVEDQHGKPMKNVTVKFEANGSMVSFDNGESVRQVDTDIIGRAKVQARLGKLLGKQKIIAQVNGEANLSETFEVESRVGPADKMYVLAGHLQTGSPGSHLPEPLRLKLEDACGNPVPDQAVLFEVTYNTGRLDRDKTRLEVKTNEDGVAAVGFRLGETPGVNIVKATVKPKGGRKLETSFESMGRE
ncbi:MAG: MotA/TolQ/ExbB proton channel family protein [candidate division KSB1 bacterium]|nr:MotA/TolQ/ExbB proton channel family protein [candidate division KSB1 bacterium]MDZ7365970.1 MotA/TolQ/ExbB proton channel family protein [candidate division KSB1 bacterium]MDZ7404086.1 MotA/TolQ/ExbB proton channel family protein [candidate division KSB1 bacterium]